MSNIYCKKCWYFEPDGYLKTNWAGDYRGDKCNNFKAWIKEKTPTQLNYEKDCVKINVHNNCPSFVAIGYKKEPIKLFGFITPFYKTIKYKKLKIDEQT